MGLLGEIFSTSDTLKRRIRGLLSDPIGSLQQLDDQAKNYNNNVRPVISGGLLDNRPLTEKEKQQQAMELAMSFSPVGMTKVAPRREAMEIARKNAVKMLGLPENNTAMDRRAAMPEFGMDLYRGFYPDAPPGQWYARTPAQETQNYPAMMKFAGPVNGLITGGKGKTYGAKFSDDVIQLLRDQGEGKMASKMEAEIGGKPFEHGEMLSYLRMMFGGGERGEKSALDIYNKLAKTKGFSGGDATGGTVLLHESTPVRAITAAFDPARRLELNPLAGLLLLDTSAGDPKNK